MKIKKVTKNFFTPENIYEQAAGKAYDAIVENFPQTFFVGGMVRDLLLSKKIMDIDIATEATPEKVITVLKGLDLILDLSAKRFGVVGIMVGKQRVEITSFRKDVYNNSRYPKISFVKSASIDSKRRDFTINSLYFQGKTLNIYDYNSGLSDLSKKQIRFIGQPTLRIQEDPLRIIRAYRFRNQLHFKLEHNTNLAIENNLSEISKLNMNRIQTELKKIKSIKSRQEIKNILHKYLQLK